MIYTVITTYYSMHTGTMTYYSIYSIHVFQEHIYRLMFYYNIDYNRDRYIYVNKYNNTQTNTHP